MSATSEMTKLLNIHIERDARGVFVATSPDLRGFSAVSKDRSKLMSELIPRAISDLYLAAGQRVIVSPLEPNDPNSNDVPWIAMPAALAQRQLDEIGA